jgi:SAM-dependent methyltransferase
MDLKEQDILGDAIGTHWYYRAKGDAMRKLLGAAPIRHVLDVGAGSGVFSRLLLDHGAGEATCVDPGYPADSSELHASRPLRFVRDVATFDGDLVLLMDVLEHVDDAAALLQLYVDKSAPGTRFLITVPAFAWMWSGHDVFLEHRRRFTLPEVEALVRGAGLVPVTGCYFYGLTLPLAATRRLLKRVANGAAPVAKSDLMRHSAFVNGLLYALCRLELGAFAHNRAAGLSVFCLAELQKEGVLS